MSLMLWEPAERSESKVEIDEQTQNRSKEAPDGDKGFDVNDVRGDER